MLQLSATDLNRLIDAQNNRQREVWERSPVGGDMTAWRAERDLLDRLVATRDALKIDAEVLP